MLVAIICQANSPGLTQSSHNKRRRYLQKLIREQLSTCLYVMGSGAHPRRTPLSVGPTLVVTLTHSEKFIYLQKLRRGDNPRYIHLHSDLTIETLRR
jgi:hypothetical protein